MILPKPYFYVFVVHVSSEHSKLAVTFFNRLGIILLIYTLVDKNDFGNFFADHAMIYPHRKYNFTSEKVHSNMLYCDLEWWVLKLHVHVKIYYRNLTLNISWWFQSSYCSHKHIPDFNKNISRTATTVSWDLEKERCRIKSHMVPWSKTPYIWITIKWRSLRWIFNKELLTFLIYS